MDALGFGTTANKANPKAISSVSNKGATQKDINAFSANAAPALQGVIGQGNDNSYKTYLQNQKTKQKPAPQPAAKPNLGGPTNSWARLAQVGIGKVNLYNAYQSVVEHKPANVNANNKAALKQTGHAAADVGQGIGKTTRAVARPVIDIASGQGGKLSHDTAQFGSDVTGGAGNYLLNAAIANPVKTTAAQVTGNKKAEFNANVAANKNLGLDKGNSLKKGAIKLGGEALQTAALAVGGPEAKAALKGEEAAKAAEVASKLPKPPFKLATAGAAGNTGNTLANNPSATKKDLDKSAGEGFLGGTATGFGLEALGRTHAALKTAAGKDKSVNTAVTNARTAALVNKGRTANAEEALSNKITDKSKLLPAGEKQPVKGEGFTMTPKASTQAVTKGQEINRLQTRVTQFQQGKLKITPEQAKADAQQLANLKSGKVSATEQLTGKSNAVASKVEESSISGNVSRPKAPAKEPEPLVNTNKSVNSLVNKLTPARLKGSLNPVDAAAREGHTTFANTARSIAGRKIYALRNGNNISNKFDQLYASHLAQGGTHQSFIKDVESGKLGSQAKDYWSQIHQDTGKAMVESGVSKGARDATYVPRVGQFPNKKIGFGGSGLSKSVGSSKARIQGMVDEFGNSSDLFKTHGQYQAHVEAQGGKVITDPRDILRHTLPSKLEAVENARGLSKLDKTAMADGRPATVTVGTDKSLPHEFSDYKQVDGLQGRAVHPSAVKTVHALTHVYSPDEIGSSIAKVNSFTKQLVTLNGLVHGKNFGLASLRKQGAIHTATAILHSNKDLGTKFGEDNVKRAIIKGGVVPFEQNKQDMFDRISNPSETKSWSRVTSFPHKVAEGERNILFNKIGNHLQFSTYFNIEKQMLKKGLDEDEAARVAGQAAKNVSFISSPVETSVAYRKGARMVAFAGQYFKSTLNEGAKATGISRDATLSGAAQRQVQKNAIGGLARGFTQLFALAQGINYATTGHSTLQNKDSKISPVIWVDKSTNKEYHATNWFGQIGDIMHITNPQEWINKSSPALQGIARVISNQDYSGQSVRDKSASGARQSAQIVGNFLENAITPFGISGGNVNQLFGKGGQPGAVTGAKLLGYGTSTKDQNPMEKQIDKFYSTNLPANVKYDQQLSTLKAQAANDVKQGNSNSQAVQKLKGQITPTQFKTFMKSGTLNPATQHFNKLSPDQKMQILQKSTPQQLKELDLSTFMTDLAYKKATTQSLQQKGYTNQQIESVIQKTGYNNQKLMQLKQAAKASASAAAKKNAHNPKFVSPFTQSAAPSPSPTATTANFKFVGNPNPAKGKASFNIVGGGTPVSTPKASNYKPVGTSIPVDKLQLYSNKSGQYWYEDANGRKITAKRGTPLLQTKKLPENAIYVRSA